MSYVLPTISMRHALPAIGSIALVALTLLIADVALLSFMPHTYQIDAGAYRAGFFLTDVGAPETNDSGDTYRWTLGESSFRLAPVGVDTWVRVTFALGGRPVAGTIQLSAGGRELATFAAQTEPRRISILVRQQSLEALELGLSSDTFSTAGDARTLGLKLDGITLTSIAPIAWPPVVPFAAQLVIVLLAWATAGRLGVGTTRVPLAAALIVALALTLALTLPMADVYLVRLACASAVLALATWLLLPWIETLPLLAGDRREARLLWALMLAACAVRAVGTLFPTFVGKDLPFHEDLLRDVLNGDLLLATRSSEFAGGAIIYPPGTYLTLAPGVLLTHDLQSLLQGALPLLDGWALALLLLLFSLLLHDGVAILATTWVAAALMLLWLRREHRQWWAPLLYAGAGIIALVCLYSYALDTMLSQATAAVSTTTTRNAAQTATIFKGTIPLIVKGARLAFSDLGLLLLPVGFVLLWRSPLAFSRRAIVSAWLLTWLCYFMIDLLLALQVRYFYFAVPIASILIAAALSRIAAFGGWGRRLAWALALLIFIQGVSPWFGAAFGDVHLSLTPLTH